VDAAYRDFLATIVEFAGDAVIGEACDGVILSWNAAAERMYGYSAKEVIGKSIAMLDASHSRKDVYRILRLVSNDMSSDIYETTHRKKNGTLIDVSLSLSLLRDVSGAIIGASTISRDITDHKRSEESLKTSERFLSNVFESIVEGLVVLDKDLRISRVNNAIRERFAASAPLEGKKCHEVFHGSRRPCDYCPSVEVLNTGMSSHKVAPIIDADGKLCGWNDLYSFPLVDQPTGKVTGILKYVINGTDRKRSEEESQETLARLNCLVEAVPDIVFFKDCEERLQIVNKAYERFAGIEKKDIIGKTTHDLFPAATVKQIRAGDQHALMTATSTHAQQVVTDGQGAGRWFDVVKFPVHDADGKIIGLGGVARDITHHKAAERERDKLRRQLLQAQKMEAIGTLAGGIAHDFNNILTIIQGYSELLLADKTEEDPAFDDLQKIILTARKGTELVQRLLTFSRKAEMKPVPLDLNRRLERMKKLLSRTVPKVIEIDLRLSQDVAMITADPTQVDQVVLNLALNAVEAMPDGGRLTIETGMTALDQTYCRSRRGVDPGLYVTLIISDTGRGMDQHTIERIFDPFFTTKERNSRKGTGLGLSVALGSIEQQGGHVSCESSPGQGTTFKVYFPALNALEEADEVIDRPAFRFDGQTILLVDDEEHVRDLGKRILEGAGYSVLCAGNGKEALEIFRQRPSDIALVILDLIMPEMDGKQCLDELLKINPTVKVLVATGFSPDAATKRRLRASSWGWAPKPYTLKDFLDAVSDVLSSASREDLQETDIDEDYALIGGRASVSYPDSAPISTGVDNHGRRLQ
jgi:two-component system, cell cycle sensor histidine kinase and response regulator CckA